MTKILKNLTDALPIVTRAVCWNCKTCLEKSDMMIVDVATAKAYCSFSCRLEDRGEESQSTFGHLAV